MNKIIISFLLVLALFGCQDFEEYQTDPNRASEATPGLLLTNLEIQAFNSISLDAALASRQLVNINLTSVYQYYNWTQGSYYNYQTLLQVIKMQEEAEKIGDKNFIALSKFFKAYLFVQLTSQFGDVPYFDALEGEDGVFKPAYDKQEDIYVDILKLLKEANNEISPAEGSITGDVVYNGDHLKWRKLVNSFRLRVLMSLSAKTGNKKLNVVEEFKEMVDHPAKYPLMESNDDNCAYSYSFEAGNIYPFYKKAYILTAHIMEETFVNRLKTLEDPRLFVLADQDAKSEEQNEFDFTAYSGFNGSASMGDNTNRLKDGEGSPIDIRYIENPEAEDNLAMGAAEVAFTLAEAAKRGWIDEKADGYYQSGIRMSMEYYGIAQAEIKSYLENPAVVFSDENGLEQILTQKHTAMFLNSGWESFYNQRRTGIPEFDTSGSGILNDGRIPKRWKYPLSEIELNLENLTKAVEQQYTEDDINEVMWLLKEE